MVLLTLALLPLLSSGTLQPSAASLNSGTVFTENAVGAGLIYTVLGRSGVAIGDANGDGWEDVVFSGSTVDGVKLFLNQQDGTFSDATIANLPLDTPLAWETQFADLDNDGDLDLALARWYDASGSDTGFWWLENDGSGLYTHGPVVTDLARTSDVVGSMAAADTDRDGDLDIILLHNTGPGWFLSNDGDGNFSDATGIVGGALSDSKRHWSGPLGDYDKDGWMDLHVAIDGGYDYHVRNAGDGTFEDVSVQVGVSNAGSDMGVIPGDFDGDGDIDLYSTNIGYNVLYVNDGAGNFTDQGLARGVRASNGFPLQVGWGTIFADLDNDLDEDLVYVVSNFVQGNYGQAFLNDGTGNFVDGTSSLGLDSSLGGRSLAVFDFDRDGDQDMLAAGYFGNPQFFVNGLNPAGQTDANWLEIELVGRSSAPQGIGAWIEVTAAGKTQTRHLTSGGSMNTGVSMRQHFGLGSATVVDRVVIRWPSGVRQERQNLAPGQILRVRELGSIKPL
ncbi:MAG: hypothetical protein ACI8QS_000877 [Planctomycetota bacterium]|jgi:hypothetical protein